VRYLSSLCLLALVCAAHAQQNLMSTIPLVPTTTLPPGALDYWVRKGTADNVCRIGTGLPAPVIGPKFKGPFDTRTEAVHVMCRLVDKTKTDPLKCWGIMPADACKGIP
jgi:hypothetical protein